MKRAAAAWVAGAFVLAACASSPASVTTSIREGDCSTPAADLKARFDERGLGVQQCKGAFGWDVLLVSSDANSWIELRSPATAWSSESAIVYEMPIGLFPGVHAESPLEWRGDRDRPTALLFTVSAQDPDDAETRVTRVFVARFGGDVPVCVVARAASIDDARTAADGDRGCAG
jgi:hypothetical protein